MTNAEKFKNTFGLYATEFWAKPEKDMLEWLNASYDDNNNFIDMNTLRFVCNNAGLTFLFEKKDFITYKKNRWTISITEEELDQIINNFKQLKFIINYEEKTTKT